MKKIKYDLTLIIRGDKSIDEAQKIFDDIKIKLEKLNYTIDKAINPVLRELTFEINKFKQGYYCTFVFEAETFANSQIEELFKFDENILRFLTVIFNDALAKPRMRINLRRQREADKKEVISEVKTEDVVEEVSPVEEVVTTEEIEKIEEQKAMDLEHLDEKLDELLK
jgi:ribosomal protein S6